MRRKRAQFHPLGSVPLHLNELSPEGARGTFPGFTYQIGNLLASVNATLRASIAESRRGDNSLALALVAGIVAIAVALLSRLGNERKGIAFGRSAAAASD